VWPRFNSAIASTTTQAMKTPILMRSQTPSSGVDWFEPTPGAAREERRSRSCQRSRASGIPGPPAGCWRTTARPPATRAPSHRSRAASAHIMRGVIEPAPWNDACPSVAKPQIHGSCLRALSLQSRRRAGTRCAPRLQSADRAQSGTRVQVLREVRPQGSAQSRRRRCSREVCARLRVVRGDAGHHERRMGHRRARTPRSSAFTACPRSSSRSGRPAWR